MGKGGGESRWTNLWFRLKVEFMKPDCLPTKLSILCPAILPWAIRDELCNATL